MIESGSSARGGVYVTVTKGDLPLCRGIGYIVLCWPPSRGLTRTYTYSVLQRDMLDPWNARATNIFSPHHHGSDARVT